MSFVAVEFTENKLPIEAPTAEYFAPQDITIENVQQTEQALQLSESEKLFFYTGIVYAMNLCLLGRMKDLSPFNPKVRQTQKQALARLEDLNGISARFLAKGIASHRMMEISRKAEQIGQEFGQLNGKELTEISDQLGEIIDTIGLR